VHGYTGTLCVTSEPPRRVRPWAPPEERAAKASAKDNSYAKAGPHSSCPPRLPRHMHTRAECMMPSHDNVILHNLRRSFHEATPCHDHFILHICDPRSLSLHAIL